MKILLSSFMAIITMATSQNIDYNVAPPNLSTLANDTLFNTWRPRAHVLPPRYHIGDPCMHYTDPKTGLFHVGYLYTSDTTGGAAGATTDDLVIYRDTNTDPDDDIHFIVSGGINDPVAVFDGSVIPAGINGSATLLYTSVSYLPIHWTLPYTKGSETQSLAVSYDGGSNFTKIQHGPSIPGAPYGSVALNVTGFRDPFVFQSPPMDRLLGSDEGVWYAAISGGEHDVDAAVFLYRQYDPEFRDLEYLGKWWSEEPNSTWGDGMWAGRWGFNFEVANVAFLSQDGLDCEGQTFITLGTEWGYAPVEPQTSPERNMLWAAGKTTVNERGQPSFEPTMAGRLDWGLSAYAAAGKEVSSAAVTSQSSGAPDRFVSYLWLTNDFFGGNDFPVRQQGWDGTLTTGRELFRGTISNVIDNDLVQEVASWTVSRRNEDGTVELATLGQKVVREALSAFQENATNVISQHGRTIGEGAEASVAFSQSPGSKYFLLTANLSFPRNARGNDSDVQAGFEILSSEFESTRIYYQFSNESIIVDRSNSSAAAATTGGIESYNEAGKLRLFDVQDSDGSTHIETLDVKIIVDNGVVEVYANDRFALSTWVWSWYASSTGMSFFHEGSSSVKFSDTLVYEGLVDAWPERGLEA